MSIYKNPSGIFDLVNSDHSIGSFLKKEDLEFILKSNFEKFTLDNLKFNSKNLVNEWEVYNSFRKGLIVSRLDINQRSFSELILSSVIKLTYPNSIIIPQFKEKKKKIDFLVEHNNKKYLIDYDGPYHYIHYFKNWKEPDNPLIRKDKMEQLFGISYFIWPYWIPLCSTNVQSLVGENINGVAGLWSCTMFFNDFYFSNSDEIIQKISNQFGIIDLSTIYDFNPISSKPEHPILSEVRKNKKLLSKLIPPGTINTDIYIPLEFR